MADQDHTKQELLDELESLRAELDELRQAGYLQRSLRSALQERQEQLHRIIETTSEGFLMLDKGLVITEVNPAITKTLGYSRQDMIGRKVEDFYDRQYIDFYSASHQHLSFEVKFATRTGRLIPMLFNRSALLDDNGAAYGYVAFVADLTELKTAREELRRVETNYRIIYENAVQGLFQTTLEGRIIDLNPAYARILGVRFPGGTPGCRGIVHTLLSFVGRAPGRSGRPAGKRCSSKLRPPVKTQGWGHGLAAAQRPADHGR